MRIGLNLLFLIPGEVGGTETYAASLIEALGQQDRDNKYFLFIAKECAGYPFPTAPNFQKVVCPFQAQNRWARFFWEQYILPWQTRAFHLDLLHSLGYISPFFLPCRSVVTIHDLNYLAIPEAFTPFTRLVQSFFVSQSARRADHIIAVSEFTRGEIRKYLDIPGEKITAIHEAPKSRPPVQDTGAVWEQLSLRYSIHKPYMLAFSSLAPHKNIAGLLRAYTRLSTENPQAWQLVVVGHLPKKGSALHDLAGQLGLDGARVIFTGYLPDREISVLLGNAGLFVFPSLYEGFGLPVLEAMQAGIPVACSNRASLAEVAGDAAAYFDPSDIAQIAKVLSTVMSQEDQRLAFQKQGMANIQRFSWFDAAKRTIGIYGECV